jgi:hypothetical protein
MKKLKSNLITTAEAYQRHHLIKKAIDLLCAGAAWRGGSFLSNPSTAAELVSSLLDEGSIISITKSLLLHGKSVVAISPSTNTIELIQIEPDDAEEYPSSTTIQSAISSFLPQGEPILKGLESHLDLYEYAIHQSSHNPAVSSILPITLSSIHSALAIQPFMLDQDMVYNTPVQNLMASAIQYRSKVSSIRHNLQYGFNDISIQLAHILDLESVYWEWTGDWIPTGECKFGHVYQVFLSEGTALEPIKEYELGALMAAVKTGLVSKTRYKINQESYG